MASQVCCVDHQRPGTQSIAGRWFCDEHYARATYRRGGVWRSELIAVIALLVFVGVVVAVDTTLQPNLQGVALLVTGLVLALVPALLWLAFFYLQDRLEPEPVGNVARMFVIGLALAAAAGLPLTDQLFRVSDWLYRDTLSQVVGNVFIIGAVQAFLVYAAVRYFIFDSVEFDERTDGVIYGTAAALGYGTAINLQFILSNGGAALGPGEIYVAEVALAQAAFGGLLGYFLGRAKLEQEPVWWLPAGVALTAVLNGVFNLVRGQLDAGSISTSTAAALPSFTGLLLAGGLAVIVTLIVSWLINRDITRSLGRQQVVPTADPAAGDRQTTLAVLGLVAGLLLVGILGWNSAVNRTTAFEQAGIRGRYPAYFGVTTDEGEVLRVADTFGTGAEFAILELEAAEAQGAAAQLAGARGTDYEVYTVMESDTGTVNGKPALRQRFAYVIPSGLLGTAPQMIEGVDYIFTSGGRTIVVTLTSPSESLAEAEPLFARFLSSLALP